MKRASAVQSVASVQMRECRPANAFERAPGVEQADQARPSAREVAGEEQRVVVADDAVRGVRAIDPVDIETDQGIVDWTEPGDRFVRPGEIAFDQVRGSAEFLQRPRELRGCFAGLGEGPFIGPGSIISGPEYGDLSRHDGRIPNEETIGRAGVIEATQNERVGTNNLP